MRKLLVVLAGIVAITAVVTGTASADIVTPDQWMW